MDVDVGPHLPRLLRDAGLVDVEVAVQASMRQPGAGGQVLPVYVTNLHRERILALGALTEAELDNALTALRTHLADPRTSVVNLLLFQAWGRRPDR